MSVHRIAMCLLVATASAVDVNAQTDPTEQMNVMVAMQPLQQGATVGFGAVDLVAVEPFGGGRPVLNAPYAADAITEVTQVLADGNRIERRTAAKIWRDGRGRIRREQQAMALGTLVAESEHLIVTISDPVAGTFVTLDQDRKTAMRSKAMDFTIADRTMTAGKIVEGTAGVRFNPMIGGVVAAAESSTVQTESLGSREVEGVRADGQRTTTTIPAGAIGNQMPIEIVTERWFSPELQVVVSTKRSDPRFGETVYRLSNVVRAEPATALFQVPSDFRLEQPRMMTLPRGKPDPQ